MSHYFWPILTPSVKLCHVSEPCQVRHTLELEKPNACPALTWTSVGLSKIAKRLTRVTAEGSID